MNAAIRAADPASSDRISVLVHPSSFPLTKASTSRNRDALNAATPAQSTRVALGSRLSRSRIKVTTSATAPIGTFR